MRILSIPLALLLLTVPVSSMAAPAGAGEPPPMQVAPGFRLAQAGGTAEPGAPVGYSPETDPNLKPVEEQEESSKEANYGIGMNARFLFVPAGFHGGWVDKAQGVYTGAFGLEFIRRLGLLDIVAHLDTSFNNPPDGPWLGNNKSPAIDTAWLQFEHFYTLTLGVTLLGRYEIIPKLNLLYGGGVGLAIPLGTIWRIDATNCSNASDPDTCAPMGVDRQQWLTSKSYRDARLDDPRNHCPDDKKCPTGFYKEGWPVYPSLHLLMGLAYLVRDNVELRFDMGFHNAFYLGAGGHYLF